MWTASSTRAISWQVFQGKYEDDRRHSSVWSEGDWNGDGEFDSAATWLPRSRMAGMRRDRGQDAVAVPEPSGCLLLMAALPLFAWPPAEVGVPSKDPLTGRRIGGEFTVIAGRLQWELLTVALVVGVDPTGEHRNGRPNSMPRSRK